MQLSNVVANDMLLNNVDWKQKKKGRIGGRFPPSRPGFDSRR